MQPRAPVATDIVLLGAGHAHAEVLRQAAMRPVAGLRYTLIAREPDTPYSGMLPGLIRGEYAFAEAHLDCARLAAAAGARLVHAEATSIDPAARRIAVGNRPAIGFDFLSIDVGGAPEAGDGGVPVKPIGRFLERLGAIESRLGAGFRLAVVGGGAGGVELALALARRFGAGARLLLVNADAEPLARAPAAARRAVAAALTAATIEQHNDVRALGFAEGVLTLSDGATLAADEVLWATHVRGPAFLAASGLACDDQGCVRVAATLESVSHPGIFAAGDCAAIEGAPRPKAGVWAVRAGAPLAANLRRAAAGTPPRPWRPQRDALAILGLGDGTATAWRGPFAVTGAWVARWKERIDRRWMAMYQSLRPMEDGDARCGGCGAKLDAASLRATLAPLVPPPRPDIPVGLAAGDDAAVTLPPLGKAVVQSVDHFRAFVDDPWLLGRIAARHALSDLHAMGATPWTAMAMATVPYAHGSRMQDDLAAMMQGANDVLADEGCTLIGGHSAEGAELALGFAVSGLADPDSLWRLDALRPGDGLILTKPLGTGVILAAAMKGEARAVWLQAALDGMQRSNAPSVPILRAHGVRACTDITGFGLAGHLTAMLRASGLAATLDPEAVPALPGALDLLAAGHASTLAPGNRIGLDTDGDLPPLLTDPQTSGGLLAGVPNGPACVTALRAAGIPAALIGHAHAGPPGRIATGRP
jgi:selenide, water dikinase